MIAYTLESIEGGEGEAATGAIFIETPFVLESSQVEKISMDTIMNSIPNESISYLEVENQSALSSISQLDRRIEKMIKILQLMREGAIPLHPHLLRQSSKIVKLLPSPSASPAESSSALDREFSDQIATDLASVFLSAAAKNSNSLSEVTDLYALVFGDQSKAF